MYLAARKPDTTDLGGLTSFHASSRYGASVRLLARSDGPFGNDPSGQGDPSVMLARIARGRGTAATERRFINSEALLEPTTDPALV